MIERSRVQIPALGMAGELSSPGPTFCADPCVTAVALKKIMVILPQVQVDRIQPNTHAPYIYGFGKDDTVNSRMAV